MRSTADYLATLIFLGVFLGGLCWALAASLAWPAALSGIMGYAVYRNLKRQRRPLARWSK